MDILTAVIIIIGCLVVCSCIKTFLAAALFGVIWVIYTYGGDFLNMLLTF